MASKEGAVKSLSDMKLNQLISNINIETYRLLQLFLTCFSFPALSHLSVYVFQGEIR